MLSSQLREELDKKKRDKDSKSAMADKFNAASTVLINKFMAEVTAGNIELDGVTDLMRLFQIYTQVNEIKLGEEEGMGQLPALTQAQHDTMDAIVSVRGTGEEDDTSYVDMDELEKLTSEDINKLMAQREITMNKENESTG